MTLLQWKPAYMLGIPSVDHEHRQLIGLINAAYDQLEGSADRDAIEHCLEDICTGIAAHFALEERHMREAGYAEYAAHKEEHEDLLGSLMPQRPAVRGRADHLGDRVGRRLVHELPQQRHERRAADERLAGPG